MSHQVAQTIYNQMGGSHLHWGRWWMLCGLHADGGFDSLPGSHERPEYGAKTFYTRKEQTMSTDWQWQDTFDDHTCWTCPNCGDMTTTSDDQPPDHDCTCTDDDDQDDDSSSIQKGAEK